MDELRVKTENLSSEGKLMVHGGMAFAERLFDVQDKCSYWNTMFPGGRSKCREAKMALARDVVVTMVLAQESNE